jgi:hypothetical protein
MFSLSLCFMFMMLTVASQEFSCSLQRKIYVSLFNDDGLHSIIIN